MTDTSTEAVERTIDDLNECDWIEAATLLRALARERDEAKAEVKKLKTMLQSFIDYPAPDNSPPVILALKT